MPALAVFGFAYTGYSSVNLVVDPATFVTWVVSPEADTDKIATFLKSQTSRRKVLLLAQASCIKMVPKALRSQAIIAVFDTPEKLRSVAQKTKVTFMDFEFKSGSVISQKKVTPSTINALFQLGEPEEPEEGMPSIPIEVFRGADAVPNFRQGVAVAVAKLPPEDRKKAMKVFAKLFIGFHKLKDYKPARTDLLADGADKVDVMNLQKWIQTHAPLLSFQKVSKGMDIKDALATCKEQKHRKDLEFLLKLLPPRAGLKFAVTRKKKDKKDGAKAQKPRGGKRSRR